jgi:hypothetical protein
MPVRSSVYIGLTLATLISSVQFSPARAESILDQLFDSSTNQNIAGMRPGMNVDEITAHISKIAPGSDKPKLEPTAAMKNNKGQSIDYGTKLSVTDDSVVDTPVMIDALFSTKEFGTQAYALKWLVMPKYGGTELTMKVTLSRASLAFGTPTHVVKVGESIKALYFYADGKLVAPQSTAERMAECNVSATTIDCPFVEIRQDLPGENGKAEARLKQPCGTFQPRISLLAAPPIQVDWEKLEIAEDPSCDGVLSFGFNIENGTVQTIEASLIDMKMAQRIEASVRQQMKH